MYQDKLKITIENTHTFIEYSKEMDPSLQNYIIDGITATCIGKYLHFYNSGPIEREIHLYSFANTNTNIRMIKIPSGLIWEFIERLEGIEHLEFNIEILDQREIVADIPQKYEFNYELDDKQKEAIETGLIYRRGYFKAATGAGKTAIIASLIGEIGGESLVLVNGIDLAEQIADDLSEILNTPIWLIQGVKSLYKNSGKNIVVASIDTLASNFEKLKAVGWFNQFNSVYGDEIHHCTFTKGKIIRSKGKPDKRIQPGTTAYYKILQAVNAYNRFGFTATDEGSELYIRAALGKKLIDIDEDYLISIGRLSKPYVIMYYRKAAWHDEERDSTREEIYLNEERNKILLGAMIHVNRLGGSALFMLDSKKYQLDLIKNWIKWPVLIGATKRKERKIVYDQLRNGEINGIVMTVGKEGMNLPNVTCIVRASGKKSIRLVKQEKGRGSRKTEIKDKYLVIDVFDDDGTKRIQSPSTQRWRTKTGHLRKQSQERLDIYEKTKEGEIIFVETQEELNEVISRIMNGEA